MRNRAIVVCAGLSLLLAAPLWAASAACKKLVLEGETTAGQEWSAEVGQGWRFRMIPVAPGSAGYSGWEMALDRVKPAGFPDALLVANPPYGSLGVRELATTFGLRAQDVIGWSPRSFRFFSSQEDFAAARSLYARLMEERRAGRPQRGDSGAEAQLLPLLSRAATGEIRITGARLTAGEADPAPFAEGWARAFARTDYRLEPAQGKGNTARGELHALHFVLTLWLPAGWKAPVGARALPAPCISTPGGRF